MQYCIYKFKARNYLKLDGAFGYVIHIQFTICILYSEYNFSFIIYKPYLQMDCNTLWKYIN